MAQEESKKRPKEENGKRAIWRPVLGTPFSLKWPEVECQVAEKLLEELLVLLNGPPGSLSISEYKNRLRRLKKKKRPCRSADEKKLVGVKSSRSSTNMPDGQLRSLLCFKPEQEETSTRKKNCLEKETDSLDEIPQRPPFLNHVLSGINAVTKELENEIHQARGMVSGDNAHLTSSPKPTEEASISGSIHPASTFNPDETNIQPHSVEERETQSNQKSKKVLLIFVCKEDLNPTSLAEHLLSTVATLNHLRLLPSSGLECSTVPQPPVLLVPLAKGAEQRIANALGIKCAAVVALRDVHTSELIQLVKKHIKPVLPPSRARSQDRLQKSSKETSENDQLNLIPTHVKFYKTTAPTDMRKHTSERLRRKKEGKALRRKQKDPSESNKTARIDRGGKDPNTCDRKAKRKNTDACSRAKRRKGEDFFGEE